MSGRGAAGEGGAAGCNEKNKNPTIECGEKSWAVTGYIFNILSNLTALPNRKALKGPCYKHAF